MANSAFRRSDRIMRINGDGTKGKDVSQGGGDGIITTRTVYDGNSRVVGQIDDNLNKTRTFYDASRKRRAA